MPFLRQAVKQLKHFMQVSLSTVLFLKSMLPVGHFEAHKPQETQASAFMDIRVRACFDIKPRTVPTGHILVQKKRPLNQTNMAMAAARLKPRQVILAAEPKMV